VHCNHLRWQKLEKERTSSSRLRCTIDYWRFMVEKSFSCAFGTKGEDVVGSSASEGTCCIIISIAVSSWTCSLECCGIESGFASDWWTEFSCAAILWFVVSSTRTLACNHFSSTYNLNTSTNKQTFKQKKTQN
jgi:hypothetical protein